MKISRIRIHNFRSIIDADIEAHDFLMLVGANNAGKSNVINALRCFYDNLKWSEEDMPKKGKTDELSWVELSFRLTDAEWTTLKDDYKAGAIDNRLILKRYFKGENARKNQSNIYATIDGTESDTLFYGAKNVSTAKCGSVVYIPASTTPSEQMKMTGASPLRDMLNFMLKKTVAKSSAYGALGKAFDALNMEAKQPNGFLSEIACPINNALNQWNVKFDMSVNSISPEDITKSLVKYSFVDTILGDSGFDLERFGHGFQRSVIYELIRIAPTFQDEGKPEEKKEFNPLFTLLLFEEPEAYLHPSQQENMAYHLRRLGKDAEMQVVTTSHSPVFVAKNSGELCQICRVQKQGDAISRIYQLKKSETDNLLNSGGDLVKILQEYVDNTSIDENKKKIARKLIQDAPSDPEIANQHEKFRLQLWLDSDRASIFFADKVLLVEGATEKALFNYLLANDWHEFTKERVLIIDALGKYNFHRFLKLFETFGIPHGIMFDNDSAKNEHIIINQLIHDRKNKYTLSAPFEFSGCLENHLGVSLPKRDDQKPIQILKCMENKSIEANKLEELKANFVKTLAINPTAKTEEGA